MHKTVIEPVLDQSVSHRMLNQNISRGPQEDQQLLTANELEVSTLSAWIRMAKSGSGSWKRQDNRPQWSERDGPLDREPLLGRPPT
jgi:hypothetical protein